jgi:hypothetical protein
MAFLTNEKIGIFLIICFFSYIIPKDIFLLICGRMIFRIPLFLFIYKNVKLGITPFKQKHFLYGENFFKENESMFYKEISSDMLDYYEAN